MTTATATGYLGFDLVTADETHALRPGSTDILAILGAGHAVTQTYANGSTMIYGEFHLHGKRGAHYVSERRSDSQRLTWANANGYLQQVAVKGNYSARVGDLEGRARQPLGDADRVA